MVKIKLSPSKKRYQRGKHVYEYTRCYLPIPQKLFTRLEPYFKEDFQADLIDEDNKVTVTYTYLKKPKKNKPIKTSSDILKRV
jgi:hypothetical protein